MKMALTRHTKNGRPHRPLAVPIHQASRDAHIPCFHLPTRASVSR